MTVFVTITLKWVDPRLRWNVSDDTCSNLISVWTGHDVETSTIWLPEIDLLNQIEGAQSFRAVKATVYSDGTVNWMSSGGLKAFCALRGLAQIPFDTLGCQLLFSAMTRIQSPDIQYVIENPGFIDFGAFDMQYNEWRPVPEKSEQGYTVRKCCKIIELFGFCAMTGIEFFMSRPNKFFSHFFV